MVLRHHGNEPNSSNHIDNSLIEYIVLGGLSKPSKFLYIYTNTYYLLSSSSNILRDRSKSPWKNAGLNNPLALP